MEWLRRFSSSSILMDSVDAWWWYWLSVPVEWPSKSGKGMVLRIRRDRLDKFKLVAGSFDSWIRAAAELLARCRRYGDLVGDLVKKSSSRLCADEEEVLEDRLWWLLLLISLWINFPLDPDRLMSVPPELSLLWSAPSLARFPLLPRRFDFLSFVGAFSESLSLDLECLRGRDASVSSLSRKRPRLDVRLLPLLLDFVGEEGGEDGMVLLLLLFLLLVSSLLTLRSCECRLRFGDVRLFLVDRGDKEVDDTMGWMMITVTQYFKYNGNSSWWWRLTWS